MIKPLANWNVPDEYESSGVLAHKFTDSYKESDIGGIIDSLEKMLRNPKSKSQEKRNNTIMKKIDFLKTLQQYTG